MTRVLVCGAGQIGSLADRVSARPAPEGDPFAVTPDAVVVAAATPAHAGLVRQSVERGIPCFCEKPLSADVDETVALVQEVERSGAAVQVGFMRRFDPGLVALRELIVGGGLGRVHTLHVASHDHEPPPEEYIARSGGMFRDQLIHDFDMIRWVTASEVESVYAAGAVRTIEFAERYGDVDTCALVLTLTGGELVLVAGTREDGRGEDVRLEAVGSKDSAAVGMNARTPLRQLDPIGIDDGHLPYMSAFDRFSAGYVAEMEHFLALAAGRAENPCPPRDALGTLLVAVAAERPRAANAPVAVQHARDLV